MWLSDLRQPIQPCAKLHPNLLLIKMIHTVPSVGFGTGKYPRPRCFQNGCCGYTVLAYCGIPLLTCTHGFGYTLVNSSKLNYTICSSYLFFIICFNHFCGLVLIFRIKPTPLAFRLIAQSQALKLNSFHLNNTNLHVSKPSHTLFAKTEPGQLGFRFIP